jgi:hypothetical protein
MRPGHRLDDTHRAREAQSPSRASRRLLISLTTAAAALTFGALVCEVVLRWVWRGDNVHTTATLGAFAADPELGWINRPGHHVTRRWLGRDIIVRIDETGRRVQEGVHAHTPGAHLAFAGDSFVFGYEVDAEETFVELVGSAMDLETVNLGVGGYRLGQSAGMLVRHLERHRGAELGVLVIYIGNDLEYGAHAPPGSRVIAGGHLVRADRGAFAELRASALKRSRLLFGLHRIWLRLRPEPSTPRGPAAPRARWIYDQQQLAPHRFAEHRAVLAKLDQRARSLGVPLLVMLLPERGQVYGDLGDLPNRAVDAMLADLGLARLDLLPSMRSAAVERPPLWHETVEGHLSSEGHRVVADVFIEWLASWRSPQGDAGARPETER